MRPDPTGLSDAQLIDAANADAFAVVYDRHVERVFRWARARVGDYGADLTAEVFARAWLKRSSFRNEADGSAFPWLIGIATNVSCTNERWSRSTAGPPFPTSYGPRATRRTRIE